MIHTSCTNSPQNTTKPAKSYYLPGFYFAGIKKVKVEQF